MKILYITTVGTTMGFFVPVIRELLDRGHQVDIACNETAGSVSAVYRQWNCTVHPLSCSRYPWDRGNWEAVEEIRNLVEANHYDIVHCHTPIVAACARLACRKARKQGTKVFYTAHGFHFYKGAPLANWLIYFPVEWICAWWTDLLITINREDYNLARKWMAAKRVEYVPGVGIDPEQFAPNVGDRLSKRRELGISEDATVLLSVGELSVRKNHSVLLEAAAQLPQLQIVIAGSGPLGDELQAQAERLGIEDRVRLLGYRKDVAQLCAMCDIFALPSWQEGLPVALMEAMASGKTVVCSRIRGNTDLLGSDSALLFDPADAADCRRAIRAAMDCDRSARGAENRERIQPFTVEHVVKTMLPLYGER